MATAKHLRVVLIWHGTILEERTLEKPTPITIGPTPRATFSLPRHAGLPKRFALLRPGKQKPGYLLTLGPGMGGRLSIDDQVHSVESFLAEGDEKGFRAASVGPGDWGLISLDADKGVFRGDGDLQIFFQFVSSPERIAQKTLRDFDRYLLQGLVFAAVLHVALLVVSMLAWEEPPAPPLEITPERFAKYFVARPPENEGSSPDAKERKKREDEGQSKRMKGQEGKLGRADAHAKDTVLPKGQKDVLRETVAKKSPLLRALGGAKPGGSGLGKLLSADGNNDVEQAINGLQGASLVVGRGSGGLSTRGTGTGGGGTGMGHILGTGELDTGGGHGHGRGGPGLGARKEHEVKVEVKTGTPESDGSLSREQINRVVLAHQAAIKYCYEKELQRQPSLAGKIDIFWVILPDGTVQKSHVASSTMGNAAVEGCIVRQVKQWMFPKSEGQTVVQLYPFIFKGGL